MIVPESADTIRLIYSSYINGMGFKAIARMLNEQNHKTPAKMHLELIGKKMPRDQEKILKKYLCDATMVSRILQEEAYPWIFTSRLRFRITRIPMRTAC